MPERGNLKSTQFDLPARCKLLLWLYYQNRKSLICRHSLIHLDPSCNLCNYRQNQWRGISCMSLCQSIYQSTLCKGAVVKIQHRNWLLRCHMSSCTTGRMKSGRQRLPACWCSTRCWLWSIDDIVLFDQAQWQSSCPSSQIRFEDQSQAHTPQQYHG